MNLSWAGVAALLLFVVSGPVDLLATQELLVLREQFEAGLDDWEKVRLDRRQTSFNTATMGSERVLVATSNNGAAGLLRTFETPAPGMATIQWRWRVESSLAENDRELERKGDDYAARVFVMFGDEPFQRGTRALSYVWAGQQPIGARYRNPVVDDVATIVLETGDTKAGRWVRERRNLMIDFEEAFGEPPPGITAIAIVVDTDDTSSDAISWFDDIILEVRPAGSPAER